MRSTVTYVQWWFSARRHLFEYEQDQEDQEDQEERN